MVDFVNVLDAAVIGSIMGIMEIIKAADKNHKLGRFYPLFVLILALAAAAFMARPFTWQTFGHQALVYAGSSSFIFKFGKTTVLGK